MFRRSNIKLIMMTGLLLVLSACGLSSEPQIVGEIPTLVPTRAVSAAPAATQDAAAPVATQDATPAGTQADPGPRIGSISGQIRNITANASIAPNLPVDLHIVDSQENETTLKTMADKAGKFVFPEVTLATDKVYYVSTTYLDRRFDGDAKNGDPASGKMELRLDISEMTDNPAAVSIENMLVQYARDEQGFTVVQITRFTNSTDRIFSTNQKLSDGRYGSVVFKLPPGAKIVRFANGDTRYSVGADGTTITDTQPVEPGSRHIVHVMYQVPYGTEGATLAQPVGYAINGVVTIMTPSDVVAQVRGESSTGAVTLASGGTQQMGDQNFAIFTGQVTLPAGSTLTTRLSQAGQPPVNTTNASQILLLGGIALMLIGGVLFMREFATKKTARPKPRGGLDALIAELADLEDQHAKQAVSNTRYRRRRQELKEQIAILMQQEKPKQ